MPVLPPRIVVAGTHSGVGKTTVTTGVMAALTARGYRVGAAKVGPDFIDPGYHALAVGRPSRNLDMWMSGRDAIAPLAARAGRDTDVLVVEGVMGLFDGAADGTASSTAEVAVQLDAPVVLVVDAASMAQSVAALVHGFATHDRRVRIGGLVLNRVGSDSHEAMLRAALEPLGIPVLGAMRRDDRLQWRDRHLGLVPVAEHPDRIATSLDQLAELVAQRCDLDALIGLARRAPARAVEPPPEAEPVTAAGRIALAAGPAFSFTYPDNVEALAAAGAEIVPFDPCEDPELPDGCSGLVIGGGFPEVYAEHLSANRPLLDDVRHQVRGGLVTWAECGGLLWLCRELGGHPMAGALPATATMGDRVVLGYRTATTTAATPLGPAGTRLRGHEHHYSTTEPAGDLLELDGRNGRSRGGFGGRHLVASYVHTHLGARPDLARAFVAACAALPLPYPH